MGEEGLSTEDIRDLLRMVEMCTLNVVVVARRNTAGEENFSSIHVRFSIWGPDIRLAKDKLTRGKQKFVNCISRMYTWHYLVISNPKG